MSGSARIALGTDQVDGSRPVSDRLFPAISMRSRNFIDSSGTAAAHSRGLGLRRSARRGLIDGSANESHELALNRAMMHKGAHAKLVEHGVGDILD
jgi:hypothetical protein